MKRRMAMAGLAILGVLTTSLGAFAREWEIDYDKAAEKAAAENKYMLLDFSGSDWCGWCIKLDKEVFSKKPFKDYAKDNLVCMLVDFPRGKNQPKRVKEQNQELQTKYKIEGYPTIIILDPKGNLVGRTGYQPGGAEAYVEHLDKIISKHKASQPAQDSTNAVTQTSQKASSTRTTSGKPRTAGNSKTPAKPAATP